MFLSLMEVRKLYFWLGRSVWCLLLTVLCCSVYPVVGGDAEALLEFQSALNGPTFQGWNASNVANLCSQWEGISCLENGRVWKLYINLPKFAPLDSKAGIISPALTTLTELKTLFLVGLPVSGDFPQALWTLPKLDAVTLKYSSLSVRFPTQISPLLNAVSFDGIKMDSPIPDAFNWDMFTSFSVQASDIMCPLPQGLLNRLSTNSSFGCLFQFSPLPVVGDKICNQVLRQDFHCIVAPSILPMLPSPNVTPGKEVLFTARYQQIQLEFEKFEVKIYGVTSRNVTFYDEFISINLQPVKLVMEPKYKGNNLPLDQFVMSPFEAFQWVNSTIFHASATMTSRGGQTMTATIIFDFAPSTRSIMAGGPGSVKFSVSITNNNYNWTSPGGALDFLVSYRGQHSPVNGAPLYCTPTALSTQCSTPVANLSFFFDVKDITITSFTLTTLRASLAFAYWLVGSVDGARLDGSNTHLLASYYMPEIGFTNFINYLSHHNQSDLLPRAGPAQNQSWNVAFSVEVPAWKGVLVYDPDIQIQLLFDIQGETDSSGIIAGAVIGSILGVSVIAGFILAYVLAPSFRAKISPFRDVERPIMAENEVELQSNDLSSDTQPRKAKKWASANPTTP